MCPDRADENVLLYIYEYLQWVGMKQSCSMLLFESPVKIDASVVDLSEISDPEFCPRLHRLLVGKEDSFGEEEDELQNIFEPTAGDVPGLIHPFSGSIRSRSASQLKITDEMKDESPKISRTSSLPKTIASKIKSEERLINFSFEEPSALKIDLEKGKEELKEPLGKPLREQETSNRNILDLTFTPEQPMFASRKPIDEQISTKKPTEAVHPLDDEISSITSDDEKEKISFENRNNNIQNTSINEDDANEANNLSHEEDKSSPGKNQNVHVDKNLNSLGKKSSGGRDSYGNDDFDDISTSEMLSLEIEEDDTQDISVATDTFGMSACDHIVNLK